MGRRPVGFRGGRLYAWSSSVPVTKAFQCTMHCFAAGVESMANALDDINVSRMSETSSRQPYIPWQVHWRSNIVPNVC